MIFTNNATTVSVGFYSCIALLCKQIKMVCAQCSWGRKISINFYSKYRLFIAFQAKNVYA